uniref:Fatty acid desaturase domain-containing protein n=1 Tax=Opuntia streptacantha TaxID=393608 RepID=A0A7C9CIB8_OPUST
MASTAVDPLFVIKGNLSYRTPIQLAPFRASGISCINFQFQRSCQKSLGNVTLHHDKWMAMRRSKFLQHVVVPMAPTAPSPAADDPDYLKKLAESYGFQQIGEPLPDDVTLRDIITSLPKKVFDIDDMKAWGSVLISVTSYVLGIFMIAKAPWYLLPLAWAWTGTAITGFFVIGHDCAHRSFARNKLLEDIVGTLAFMPLIYPYEPWRFKHDQHHAKTNMLHEDTAWHPVWKEDIEASPTLRKALIFGYGPFRTFMSIAHWLLWHFDLKKFRQSEVNRVLISLSAVFAFMGVVWPLIIYKTGIAGWVKFWLMPWMGYHFWVSKLSFPTLLIYHSECAISSNLHG